MDVKTINQLRDTGFLGRSRLALVFPSSVLESCQMTITHRDWGCQDWIWDLRFEILDLRLEIWDWGAGRYSRVRASFISRLLRLWKGIYLIF